MSAVERKPSDIVSPGVEWFCWCPSGWEDAGEGSVQDAHDTTRGQAAAHFASCGCHAMTEVRAWKRYVRCFTRQDVWDGPGKDRWTDHRREAEILAQRALEGRPGTGIPSLGDLYRQAPTEPPADWEPDEYDPVWQFVRRDHPDAIAVWVCGMADDEPPENPERPS